MTKEHIDEIDNNEKRIEKVIDIQLINGESERKSESRLGNKGKWINIMDNYVRENKHVNENQIDVSLSYSAMWADQRTPSCLVDVARLTYSVTW